MSSISVTIVQSLSMVTQPIMTSALCFQDSASNIEDACLAIVCRDRPSLPFRCLDPQYRRELVRVYLTNVEGICRRFVEEKQESLLRIRETAASFKAYWISQSASERKLLVQHKGADMLKVSRPYNMSCLSACHASVTLWH